MDVLYDQNSYYGAFQPNTFDFFFSVNISYKSYMSLVDRRERLKQFKKIIFCNYVLKFPSRIVLCTSCMHVSLDINYQIK